MQSKIALALASILLASSAPGQVVSGFTGPAQVESSTVILDSSGNATWTFVPAFPAVPDVTHIPQAVDTTNPLICNYTSRTATAVTIHCWRSNTLAGLLSGIFGGTTTGAQVNLIARYRSS